MHTKSNLLIPLWVFFFLYKRFRPPQPVVPVSKDKPFIAHKYSETCPQGNANPLFSPVGENCLSVNIWAPPNARNLPVMVYSESAQVMRRS